MNEMFVVLPHDNIVEAEKGRDCNLRFSDEQKEKKR